MDLRIASLGEPRRLSPLARSAARGGHVRHFVSEREKVLYRVVAGESPAGAEVAFEHAGPREHIFFDPAKLRAGIVTCGGLCPGTNSVIRSAVMELLYNYGVPTVYGFRYGFAGLVPGSCGEPIELTADVVDDIHHRGGTILGSSRGPQHIAAMVDTLERMEIGLLLVIGGDGTMRGAEEMYAEIARRGLSISVIGVPKTIDNDIYLVERTFGFETAFSIAIQAIRSAHTEAKGYLNGIGLVRLMGRQSGYIAASAAVAEPDVNLVLVPEVRFVVDGERGLLAWIERRLAARRHAVIVVAEGAGQDLLQADTEATDTDASGNVRLRDVGQFLRRRISEHLEARKVPHSLKYIDPSYMIRTAPANPNDSIFSSSLARNAVHAGMCGKTGMLVGLWNNQFTHVPTREVVGHRNTIDPKGDLWLAVLESTGQPSEWT